MRLFDNINNVISALLRNEVSSIEYIVDISSRKSLKAFIYLAQAMMVPGKLKRGLTRTVYTSNLKSSCLDTSNLEGEIANRVYIGITPSPAEIKKVYAHSGSIIIIPEESFYYPEDDKKVIVYNSDIDDAVAAIDTYVTVNWHGYMWGPANRILKKILDGKVSSRYPFSCEALYAYCAINSDNMDEDISSLEELMNPSDEEKKILWGEMWVHKTMTSRLLLLVSLSFSRNMEEFDETVKLITSSYCSKELMDSQATIN